MSPELKFDIASSLYAKITDGTHDSPKQHESGKHLITSKHIKGRNIDFESAYLISEHDFNQINLRSSVDQWDVIVSMIGEYCGFCYIERNCSIDYAVKNVGLYKAGSKLEAEWLYYYLTSPIGKQYLSSVKSGSSQPYLTLGGLRKLPILTPENKSIKERIVKTLSDIDKKIELNNKINTELEAMAKLIYDYWFVQFDFPDANGKPYKSSGGKMVYNEALKREIPDGWSVDSLGKIVDVISDTVSSKSICSSTYYIGLEHIPRKTIVLSTWETAAKINSNKSSFKRMDILFGKIRPYFHKVGVCFIDGITSTDTVVLRAKKTKFHGLALQTVFTEQFVAAATNSSTGSKMPRANWAVLEKYKIPIPPNNLLHNYQSLLDDILAQIQNLIFQSKELVELRDWLLPMLMNGQVTVNDSSPST